MFNCHLSINRFLPFRPGLPSSVNPQPLIGVLPHVPFQNLIKQPRVFRDVVCKVSRFDQLHRWIELQPVLSEAFFPNQKSRQDGGPGSERESCNCGCRCGGGAQKVPKQDLLPPRVLLLQNSAALVLARGPEGVASCAFSLDGDD